MMHVLWQTEEEGTIGWQNRVGTLPWQGYFRITDDEGTLDLAFDCYGRGKMKSARLYKRADGLYEGFDYRCRFVRIEKLFQMY